MSPDFLTVPEILSHLPRQISMTKIFFRFIICDDRLPLLIEFAEQSDLDAAWSTIDSLLTRRSFPALTDFSCYVQLINHEDTLESTGIVKYLEQKLPKCKKRGLIHIYLWDLMHMLSRGIGADETCQCS